MNVGGSVYNEYESTVVGANAVEGGNACVMRAIVRVQSMKCEKDDCGVRGCVRGHTTEKADVSSAHRAQSERTSQLLGDDAASPGMLGHGSDDGGRRSSKCHTEDGVRSSKANTKQ